ncbi:MAG TPA: glycerol-3-phosphate 1-O-acyltransferase PlsY [Burkholderiales bacterium]|nr:glycerol-3-phosphate 1-O-acyltransferase PlsY [Burkholderiales bacterium]
MQTVLIVLAAYLLGSVSFAIVVSRVLALPDPRSYGSKNPGATNVLRSGSKVAAVLTLLGDAGKGWLAVWLAAAFAGTAAVAGLAAPLAGLAVFAGHLFPVFHRFRGGKGVATAAGVLLGFDPWLGLATIATWIVFVLFFRISSLAALAAALFAPFYAWWLFGLRPLLAAVLAIALLLVWRHRANIARLVAGTEPRIR